jgi:hypothetical protein
MTLINRHPEQIGLIRIIDLNQTHTAVQATLLLMDSTQQAQLQSDLDLQATALALGQFSVALNQTETQQRFNQNATSTGVALANAQQATQAAANFAATQSALQATGTQVQLDFQATQTDLFDQGATIQANQTPVNVMILNGDFINALELARQQPISQAWAYSSSGALVAQLNPAILLTAQTDFGMNYRVQVHLIPLKDTDHWVLFGVQSGRAYGLRLQFTERRLISIELHEVILNVGGAITSTVLIETSDPLNTERLALTLDMGGKVVSVSLSDRIVLNAALPTAPVVGAVGVQVPDGTQLTHLRAIALP